jgi:glyoxylase-like metal-dependent hydrolase (beta-lactamase superfamily II)
MHDQQQSTYSRRNFIGSVSVLTAGVAMFPKSLFAQTDSPVIKITNAAKTAKIHITRLRKSLCMLEGSGGNITVFTGPEGKLLVDTGIDVSKPTILAALNSISSAPIKFLVNSHWHFDHANGNAWLHKAGATIIAQDVTRKHLSETIRVEDWNYTFAPLPAAGLPTVLYESEHIHHFNGEKILIKIYPHAHTDGDSSIFFPNENILHAADTFWNGFYPFIDYSTGGNITGMIKAAQMNIDRTTKDTIIVPGHGPVGNRQQLIEFHAMLVAIFEKVATLKKQGRSIDQVVAAKPTAAYDAKFGGFAINGDFFTRLVYKGA